MKSVLISVRPKWVEKIVNGEKTIEVRKSMPKLERPFKCYIYMSQGDLKDLGSYSEWFYKNRMKVIGEFTCDKIEKIVFTGNRYLIADKDEAYTNKVANESCLDFYDLVNYIGDKGGYAWHISDLKIYDKPKELSEFGRKCDYASEIHCRDCLIRGDWDSCCGVMCKPLTRPPQSWGYIR